MSAKFQISLDCSDPSRLATFWAEALGYKSEDPPKGYATWQDWLIASNIPRENWNDRAGLVDPQGIGPRILFQKVSEPKTAKNRLHLDVRPSAAGASPEERFEKAKAKAAQLVTSGATILYEMNEYGSHWITLADPEGNEFCIG